MSTYPPLTAAAQRFLAEYRARPSADWREKALSEASIWEAMKEEDRKLILKQDGYSAAWLASLCGEPVSTYIARARTLKLDFDGFPMAMAWHHLQKGESPSRVNRATTYARRAYEATVKQFRASGLDEPSSEREGRRKFLMAFERAISASNPGNPDKPAGEAAVKPRERVAPARPRQPKSITDHLVDGDGDEAKLLWQLIAGSILEPTKAFVQSRLRDLDSESVPAEIFEDFRGGIHTAFQEMLMSVRLSRQQPVAREARQIKREKLTEALEVLRVPMKRGWENKDVNVKAIKQAYRRLSARFHPDKNPGNDQIVARYHQVQQAYQLLREALGI